MTDHERITKLFRDCFFAGAWRAGLDPGSSRHELQANLTVSTAVGELAAYLNIEFVDGEIVAICGKELK